jgi:hypothetical protein
MRRFCALGAFLFGIIIFLVGCALPAHNNTLVFAVNRDIGVGVASGPTDAGVNINLGYKSRELAWVPLWANSGGDAMPCYAHSLTKTASITPGGESKTLGSATFDAGTKSCIYGPKFVASDRESNKESLFDAYSTFASFGGRIAAGGSTGSPSAEAGIQLASFFATGVAAQKLAENPNIAGATRQAATADDKPGSEKKLTPPPDDIVELLTASSKYFSSTTATLTVTVTKGTQTMTVSLSLSDCLAEARNGSGLDANDSWAKVTTSLDVWKDKYLDAAGDIRKKGKTDTNKLNFMNSKASLMLADINKRIEDDGKSRAVASLVAVCKPA